MKELKVLELFSGIRATSEALRRQGIKHSTFTVEFDESVQKVANKLWGTNDPVRDVRTFKPKDKFDLVVAGFPCQPFSKMGKGLGFNDPRGTLYQDTLRVIEESNSDYVILENVTSILNEKHKWIVDEIKETLKKLGYFVSIQKIDAKNFISQSRPRVFIIGSKISEIKNVTIPKSNHVLDDFLEKKVDKSYKFNPKTIDKNGEKKWIIKNGYIGPESRNFPGETDGVRRYYKDTYTHKGASLTSGGGTGVVQGWKSKYDKYDVDQIKDLLYENKLILRVNTPREVFRLQGWDDEQIDLVVNEFSKGDLWYVAGNSMAIPVMESIVEELLKKDN